MKNKAFIGILLLLSVTVVLISGCVVEKKYDISGTKEELMNKTERALLSYGFTIVYKNDEYGIIQAGIPESGGGFGIISQGSGIYSSKPPHFKEFVTITISDNTLFFKADSSFSRAEYWFDSRLRPYWPEK